MNIEDIRLFCLNKKGVTESFPFDDTTLVFKVVGKMFVLLNLADNQSINLKCNPGKAIELREHFLAVLPGYHMNKKLWNTVMLDDSILDSLLLQWIDDSYDLIVEKMPKKLRDELNNISL